MRFWIHNEDLDILETYGKVVVEISKEVLPTEINNFTLCTEVVSISDSEIIKTIRKIIDKTNGL